MNIIFLGPQSSGKGTQAEFLSQKLNIPIVTTGGIFRAKKAEGDKEIADLIDKGMLVPDEVTDRIVKEELEKDKYNNGVILDGYPRNTAQANTLEGYFKINKVIFLDVPDGVVLKRMSARRICTSCGTIFNLNSKPPKVDDKCDNCGGELAQRDDDTSQAIAKRLNIYHEHTEPLIHYYEDRLIKIDGTKSIEDVWQEIQQKLGI